MSWLPALLEEQAARRSGGPRYPAALEEAPGGEAVGLGQDAEPGVQGGGVSVKRLLERPLENVRRPRLGGRSQGSTAGVHLEPGERDALYGVPAGARPGIGCRRLRHPRTHRVELAIAAAGEQVGVGLDRTQQLSKLSPELQLHLPASGVAQTSLG
jgi:hypothetical protein